MNKERKVIFSVVQMSMKDDKEANVSKAEKMIDRAVKEHNPDIVGLPEFFNTIYFPQYVDRKYFSEGEPIPGPSVNRIARKAKEHGIYVIAPIYEKVQAGLYYDSSALIGPDGKVIGVTRKNEAPNVMYKEGGLWSNEEFYFAMSNVENAYPVFETKFGKFGQIICWNRHFPENWRLLTVKGAEIIYVPVASMGKFLSEMFSLEMRAMCYVHQCFAAVVNRVGIEGEQRMYGGSHLVNPKGKLLAGPASDTDELIVSAELNLDEIETTREEIPFTKSYYSSTLRAHAIYDSNMRLRAQPEPAETISR
jgi:N-carbamoylputrescine amidase